MTGYANTHSDLAAGIPGVPIDLFPEPEPLIWGLEAGPPRPRAKPSTRARRPPRPGPVRASARARARARAAGQARSDRFPWPSPWPTARPTMAAIEAAPALESLPGPRPVRSPRPAQRPARRPAQRRRTRPQRRAARSRRSPSRLRLLLRRLLAVSAVILVGGGLISYISAMLAPSNVSFGIRTVEWLRNNGAAWLVNDVENLYYSIHAPAKGGPALKRLPRVGLAAGAAATAAGYEPPPIAPVIAPALPGEGDWQRTGPLVAGAPPVLVTTFRPDPAYPQLVAGVAWIDHTRTAVHLYPGRYEPPAASHRGALEIPPQVRGPLLATFNSGFKLEDSNGGFVAFGRTYSPLRPGLGTMVGFRDGTVDVRAWPAGAQPGPEVVFARQNLPLIVNAGRLNPNLSDGPEWGATLGNAIRVWRSGVGIDAHGNLLYAAADGQTVTSLAQILQHAGAVRAMELDINSEWVTFNYYGAPGAAAAAKLLPGMTRPSTRYLSPDDRDFFAVFRRDQLTQRP